MSETVFNNGRTEYRTLNEARSWTTRRPEPVLDADQRIVDAHHHFYNRPDGRYLLDELYEDIAGMNMTATVFVECESKYHTTGPAELRSVGETEYVSGLGDESDRRQEGKACKVAAGIVGFADLTLGERVEAVLEQHLEAGGGRFRGIRHRTMWDPNGIGMQGKVAPLYRPGIMMDPQFRAGFSRLQQFGISFDAWQYYFQLPELIDLARAFPETPIILNHIGGIIRVGPYARSNGDLDKDWHKHMKELATLPNVVVKVGGLGMITYGFGFHLREEAPDSEEMAVLWRPYFDVSVEIFGADRCMLVSNFPADQQSCGYRPIWNAFKLLTRSYSTDERDALFWKTAMQAYKL